MPMDPITIRSSSNSNLEINAIPGHFVTSHSHINYYIDITAMKHDFTMAREAAETLAGRFSYEKPVDTTARKISMSCRLNSAQMDRLFSATIWSR